MEKIPLKDIFDSVEKLIRYLITGVLFVILLRLSNPQLFSDYIEVIANNTVVLFFIVLTIGITIYSINTLLLRFSFEILAYKLKISPVSKYTKNNSICFYLYAISKLLIDRSENKFYPKGYMQYLWAICHYLLILSELIILFSIFNEEKSYIYLHKDTFKCFGIILLILSSIHYFYLQSLEKNLMQNSNIKSINNKYKE